MRFAPESACRSPRRSRYKIIRRISSARTLCQMQHTHTMAMEHAHGQRIPLPWATAYERSKSAASVADELKSVDDLDSHRSAA
jgi:hypothetical protein